MPTRIVQSPGWLALFGSNQRRRTRSLRPESLSPLLNADATPEYAQNGASSSTDLLADGPGGQVASRGRRWERAHSDSIPTRVFGRACVIASPRTGKGRIWITWERQRRNRSLSAALGAELHELLPAFSGLRRYLWCTWRTLALLMRERPVIVFVQTPSFVLTTVAAAWCRLTNTPLVVDAHNQGVHPFDGRYASARLLARALFQAADLTIVSNAALVAFVESEGGRAFALPDPLPSLDAPRSPQVRPEGPSSAVAVFICTWASDEPYLEVIEAARHVPDVRVLITGRSRGRERARGTNLPENVVLTGFLPDAEYVALLHQADLVIDLTTREDCLVCGAYEAMAVGAPLLVSGTSALRTYFDRGTVYTDNQEADIAERIREGVRRGAELREEMRLLREQRRIEWDALREQLEGQLRAFEDPQRLA